MTSPWSTAVILLLALTGRLTTGATVVANSVNTTDLKWWQIGPVYQVYPASFADSDNDGWGDIKGITQHAQYFKDIGIGTVWLSPIYESPMRDNGYDVTDYKKVNPTFGTNDDIKELASTLHKLGLSLILDFVPNHTSNESEWFQDSVNRRNGRDDFYVWKDPKDVTATNKAGSPPSNWLTLFNTVAWTYNEVRGQYYYHEFGDYQPDLNYSNPDVVSAVEDCISYWLDLGVDGFRMDAVPYLVETNYYTDDHYNQTCGNPMNYYCYDHINSKNQQGTYDTLKAFETVLINKSTADAERAMFLEGYTDMADTMKFYSSRTLPFNFQFVSNLTRDSDANTLKKLINDWYSNLPSGAWPNWVIGNHDNSRVGTRMGSDLIDAMNMLNLLLPGTPVTYYGEEIGMLDAYIPEKDRRDLSDTRDPERTPMQWNDELNAGFSNNTANLYLPVNPNYWEVNVKNENSDDNTHLGVYKKSVALHKELLGSTLDNFNTYVISDWIFAFDRPNHLIVVNLNNLAETIKLKDIKSSLPDKVSVRIAAINAGLSDGDKVSTADQLTLRPRSGIVFKTTNEATSLQATVTTLFLVVLSFGRNYFQ